MARARPSDTVSARAAVNPLIVLLFEERGVDKNPSFRHAATGQGGSPDLDDLDPVSNLDHTRHRY